MAMEQKSGVHGQKQNVPLSVALVLGLLAVLILGGSYFTKYLEEQIFVERTTQLVEITAQVRTNLDDSLDTHWNYLTAAVNILESGQFDREEDVARFLGRLEQLLETDRYSSTLMLLDSRGNCHDASGRHGVWSDIGRISAEGDRCTFISDSYPYEGSFWAFVQKLSQPLQTGDGLSFTHAVLLKDVHTLTQYYDSAAYSHHSETYILKSNGTRMHDISQGNTLQAYNMLKVLEEMEGQRCPDIRAALSETDTLSANFFLDGREYYYCITALDDYDTLLLFLIPADFVASGTVNMVNTVIRTLLFLAAAVLVLALLSAAAVLRQRGSARLYRQEQANLRRQEELNQRLEEYNAMLTQSKESAEQAFRLAEEANRAKSSFLSNMSHDIRTPMNAIVGFASLLSRDANHPDKVLEYTKKITASSQHLLGLINDVLDISKIEAGKTTLSLSNESMVDLIESIDSIIRPQMKARGHRFEVYSLGLKHEYVVMDKLRLNQILLNLLSNAAKYTPDGGDVSFTVQELPQSAGQRAHFRFIVADNGYGMSEEYQKKLFQTFTREEDSVTNKIQGTGLGLAITKNLLDLMGGSITVDSEKGRGSTFTVDLELQAAAACVDRDFWRRHGITRLLAVDGQESVCQNIQSAMEDTGVDVAYALSGEEAVELVKQSDREGSPYSVVLLDWKMPGMDGVETARRIRQAAPGSTPILVLASCDWPDIEQEARAAGVDIFLSKPFFSGSLRQKLEGLLSRQPEQSPEQPRQHSVLQGLHILVAEDNEINAEILSELLDMAGCTCQVCENGQLAVDAFARSAPEQYQLILMDVQMPVMNGYDATRAIRKLNHPRARTVPIVAMTANAFAEDIRDALESGMNAHVAKPIDMAVLEQTVKEVLETSPQPAGRP